MSPMRSDICRSRTAVCVLALLPLCISCRTGAGAASASTPRSTNLCRPLDADGRDIRDRLMRIVSSNDSIPTQMRKMVSLARMPGDSVTLVSDAAACASASASFAAFRGPVASQYGSVYLFRLGSIYAVDRPDGHEGYDLWLMNQNFRILGGWGI